MTREAPIPEGQAAGAASEKRMWRERSRGWLREISAERRVAGSKAAVALLVAQAVWRNAHAVLLYAPMRDELDLLACAEEGQRAGKVLALPRFDRERGVYGAAVLTGPVDQLRPGAFGILEPGPAAPGLALNLLDLWLVPGLAFDRAGRRLGRGKGFYDRLLAQSSGVKCGVGFEEQIVPELPGEPHDMAMNFLLTPARWAAATRNVN